MARGTSRGGRRGTFGLTSSRGRGYGRGGFRGRGGFQKRGGGPGGSGRPGDAPPPQRGDDGTKMEEKFERSKLDDEVDEKLGFARFQEGPAREGWLVNMHTTLMKDEDNVSGRAAVDYYFIQDDGGMFKCTLLYEPYFHIACKAGTETIVEEWLMKHFEGLINRITREMKEDLKLPNHIIGHRKLYLQIHFKNITDLLSVRKELLPLALANSAKLTAVDAYAEVVNASANVQVHIEGEEEGAWGVDPDSVAAKQNRHTDPRELITDIREYDVPYYLRVAIDNNIRVGLWYTVTASQGNISMVPIPTRVKRAEPVVMAYDIEVTKLPLKFPDQAIDQIMMISYMIDGQGFLITNREIVSEDIEDFEYTPKPEYEGPFIVYNEPDEAATIRRWFSHIRESKPTVMATYNGDAFDFPFVEARAKLLGIDMFLETGFSRDSEDEFKSRSCIHMDCFRWVKRDSYLPQGSQGLKAVTTYKLGYNPIELDPELMTPYASEQPQVLAQYSVSDAVATYYLYMKYVHPFIFSLCNIIPLNPDEVLRKGSGTLCETLLMVEAYRGNIIMPNRHEEPHGRLYEGHLLASETYVGGHVEALEAGVFRSDIPTHFKMVPDAVQKLIEDLDAALKFCIVEESKMSLDDVTNYDEIKDQIQLALEELRDNPMRTDNPLIYHLDVAAMYPNIMLSNRLQPDSVVDESMCAVCDYNRPGKTCDRRLTWAWRGEFFPAKRDEYNMVKSALNQEWFPPKRPNDPKRRFTELSEVEQTALLHKRLGDYSRKVYKKTKDTKVVERETIICQRENPFYIDTVRSFRDRRYEYKGLHKTWKKNLDTAAGADGSLAEIEEAKKMIVLYDSLQLAHKCILNSFYGYVMRKGARWHSMEMAGITCLTGAKIIQMARQLVEQIGRPLELDTDGIWCMLPGKFPENFKFKLSSGKALAFSYPCTMLNHLVHAQFTNHQYHDLVDAATGTYAVHSENSIFFELDGPYKAMILPSSKEEDKLLKKRYAVFNDDGSLAELKGFEVKRRGELQLIKIFQSQIFDKFLLGTTTEECYAAVAEVADQWLDILFTKGESLSDEELVELIAENRSMSKTLAEYGAQKSTSISTAKRLADFLGAQMVKDKGLACRFIISARPAGAPVTERAVPVAIFSAEDSVKRLYLRKWLKDNSLTNFDLRSILDWNYYIERLGSVIQKLITIPAAMQKVSNPVPRIRHPDWLHKRVAALEDKFQQHKISDFFKKVDKADIVAARDIEDSADGDNSASKAVTRRSPSPIERVTVANIPNPLVDYPGWIRAMRPIWRVQREASRGNTSVPTMFRGVKTRFTRTWEVIQIRPTSTPGKFTLWLALESELVGVTLRVPRQFYLNLKLPAGDDTFGDAYTAENVVRTLPRNHPCLQLYKVTVGEETYMKEESHFARLTNNPNVDSVYEMQVPHLMRALLKFGTSCSLVANSEMNLNRARDIGFDLQELEATGRSSSHRSYVETIKAFKYMFLYHATSHSGASTRHVFGLFLPNGNVKIHIVDPSKNRQPLPKLQQTYTTLLRESRENIASGSLLEYPASLDFTVSMYPKEETAFKALSRELGLLDNRSHMIVLSSAKDLAYFDDRVPKAAKFPVLVMPKHRGMHSMDAFPWQPDVVKKMISRYLDFGPWVYDSMTECAHFDVPIGNIETDHPLYYMDLTFARRLAEKDMVLWWSPNPRPDLGGREEDCGAVEEELVNPEFCYPGCYSNVCLSVQVQNLAVNSVTQSALVNEMEGSGGATAFDSTSHTLDEYAKGEAVSAVTLGDSYVSAQTFAILKALVKTWVMQQARDPLSPSGIAVRHFWRWLSSAAAKMFDPSLHRFVHGLMRKTFIQMLAEFKRLGSNVVYADFGHLILLTSKPPGTAHAYATYLLTAVTSNELFQNIELETDRYYDFLLYMDNANQGGVICEDPLAVEPPPVVAVTMNWNIQAFLPTAVQEQFKSNVRKFILDIYRIVSLSGGSSRTPLRVMQNLTQGQGPARDASKLKENENVRVYIAQKLTRRMFKSLSTLMDEQKEAMIQDELADDFRFPLLPGSYLNMTNPSLEYVKFVCAVFTLAQEYKEELGVLRKNLLDLLGVNPFSPDGFFKNPCEPFKLCMVICQSCNSMRDFDFCRDVDLLPKESRRQSPRWLCGQCDAEYDRRAIEAALVECVRRFAAAFQLQDLRCGKCKQIKTDNLSKNCPCSGEYQLTSVKGEARRKLRTIVNVATLHNLHIVKEYAEFVLDTW